LQKLVTGSTRYCWPLAVLLAILLTGTVAHADDASATAQAAVVPGMPFAKDLQAARGYVDTPLGQLHYQQVGSGSKMIVLLHQVPWFHIYYAHAQAALAEHGMRSIAFDLPGYGLSDRLTIPPDIADYATAIRAGLDELGIDVAMIVGHHTGASVGVEIARQQPQRVACLLLHGVALYTPAEQAARLARPHWDQTPTADGGYLARRSQYLADIVVGSDAARHWSLLSMFIAGPTEWYGHHAVFRYDMAESLQNVDVPVSILSNSADLLDFTFDRVRGLRPDFSYRRLQSESSNMPFDDAGAWAAGVADEIGKCSRGT
jgi:pimeloyl-ACP methyl ester carboxylesterase